MKIKRPLQLLPGTCLCDTPANPAQCLEVWEYINGTPFGSVCRALLPGSIVSEYPAIIDHLNSMNLRAEFPALSFTAGDREVLSGEAAESLCLLAWACEGKSRDEIPGTVDAWLALSECEARALFTNVKKQGGAWNSPRTHWRRAVGVIISGADTPLQPRGIAS